MENWMEKYRLNECLLVLSMVLAFFMLAAFGQRKTWIATESVMLFISGVAFVIFPKQILSLETTGTLQDMEMDLGRFFGLTIMCSSLVWLRTKESRDGTVTLAILTSRVFASSTMLMMQCFVYFGKKPLNKKEIVKGVKQLEWSEQMLFFGIFPTLIWLLGSILHLIRSHDFNCFPQHNVSLNNHLKFEALLTFAFGTAMISFPNQILVFIFKSGGNKVALHIIRSVGAMNIGNAVLALHAPGFLHERDKRTILLIKIFTCLLQLGWFCVIQFLRQPNSYVIGLFLLPALVNAIIGYFWGGTSTYKTSINSNNNEHGKKE